MKWEFPRLCRGGSQTLRIPGVYLPLLPSFCRSPLPREPRAVAVASAFQRLRSGPFEGPATVKPPALPEDTYLPVNGQHILNESRIFRILFLVFLGSFLGQFCFCLCPPVPIARLPAGQVR